MRDSILALKSMWTEQLGDITVVVRKGDTWIKLCERDLIVQGHFEGWYVDSLPDDSDIWSDESIRELVFDSHY